MSSYDEQEDLEATEDQLELLRELGVTPQEIDGLSMAEAQALIDELRSEADAARTGNV